VAGSDKDRTSKRVDVALAATYGAVVPEQNPRIILLTAAKRAADGVEPK